MINLATFRGVGGDKITRCWFQTSLEFLHRSLGK